MNPCASFRAALEAALAGPRDGLARLADEAHVRACASCARALADERALERVLARLPAPEAPAGLAARIRAGLAAERPVEAPVPTHLSDPELDALLVRAGRVEIPADLGRQVLSGLAPERARLRRPGRILALVAALVLALLGGWAWFRARERFGPRTPGPLVVEEFDPLDVPLPPEAATLESDAELVAYALENWELLNDAEFEVWLASLDPLDQLLIENADEELLEGVLDGSAGAGR